MADTSVPTSGQNDQSANRGRNNRSRGGRGGRGGNRAPREGQDSEQGQGGNRNGGKSRGRGGRGRGGAGGVPGTHQSTETTEQQIQAKGKALALVPQTEDGDDVEAEVCFICASPVVHQSVAPCNHRTCHICSLRLRALYKTKTCAHCRVCWSLLLVSLHPLISSRQVPKKSSSPMMPTSVSRTTNPKNLPTMTII